MPQLWIFAILSGFLVKIPFLSAPLIGHFGSYQIVNAMMARAMTEGGWQAWLAPQTQILMHGKPALHLIYYPFGSFAAALLERLIPAVSLEFWGRLQASLWMAGSGVLLHKIARKFFSEQQSFLSVLFFTFSPMTLIYGVALQNEAAALFFLLAGFGLVLRSGLFASFGAGLCFSLALLARLHFFFLIPVMLLPLAATHDRWKKFFLFILGVLLPAGTWFGYTALIQNAYPDSVMTSLFMQAGEGRVMSRNLLFSKDFSQRLLKIVFTLWLTPVLFPFAVTGAFRKINGPILLALAACVFPLLTALLLPQKVYDHPFYLIAAVPGAAVLAAAGLSDFLAPRRKSWGILILGVFFLACFRYYIPPVIASFSTEARHLVAVGQAVQQKTQPEDRVIAQSGTSPELLYYTRRSGWPFDLAMAPENMTEQARHQRMKSAGYGDPQAWLEHLRTEGASKFVVSDRKALAKKADFEAYLNQHYAFEDSEGINFRIYHLKEKN